MMGFEGLESSEKKLQLDHGKCLDSMPWFFSVVLLVLTMRCCSLERQNEQR